MATADSAPVLFVASAPREFSGLLAFCRDARPVAFPLDWARAASLAGLPVLLAANGAGPTRAAAAVAVAASRQPLSAIVSTGYCGALLDTLTVGDIVVGTELEAGGRRLPLSCPRASAPHARGRIASISRVADTAREKRLLRGSGAAAVEMETAGIAEAALRAGVPVYCIRSVTDLADESFRLDLNSALRPDGHFSTASLLAQGFRRPASALPELLRLHRRCRKASRNLGDFLAHCRF